MKDIIKSSTRSFFGGCFFMLGAAVAVSIILMVIWVLPGELPFEKYMVPQPTPSLTPRPTPTGELPSISIWMTLSPEPSGERITRISKNQLPELNVWAVSSSEDSVPFRIWLFGLMGNGQWGPEFETSPDRTPISVGKFESAMLPGTYRFEVRIGDTKVGEYEFEVIE